jgi:hypothetical protein
MALGRRWQGCPKQSARGIRAAIGEWSRTATQAGIIVGNSQRKQSSSEVFFFVGGILLPITANLVS